MKENYYKKGKLVLKIFLEVRGSNGKFKRNLTTILIEYDKYIYIYSMCLN